MPNYTYKNKETGEEHTVWLSFSEHDTYLDDKPHLEQVIVSATLVDPVNIGITKPPSDFQKYVLGRVLATQPGASQVANRRWNIPREF